MAAVLPDHHRVQAGHAAGHRLRQGPAQGAATLAAVQDVEGNVGAAVHRQPQVVPAVVARHHDGDVQIGPGDVFTVPIGIPRAFANDGSEVAEAYVVRGDDYPRPPRLID